MMKQYTFAVVGALGNVGTEMRGILETSELPIGNLVLMDVSQNAGTKVKWRGEEYTVAEANADAFWGVDIAIMSAGAGASLELSLEAVKRGCVNRQFYCFQNVTGTSPGHSGSQCGGSGKSLRNNCKPKLFYNSNARGAQTDSRHIQNQTCDR